MVPSPEAEAAEATSEADEIDAPTTDADEADETDAPTPEPDAAEAATGLPGKGMFGFLKGEVVALPQRCQRSRKKLRTQRKNPLGHYQRGSRPITSLPSW